MTDQSLGPDRPNPFIRHRRHLDLYVRALDAGLDDAAYQAIVRDADVAVAAVDGTGFVETPLVTLDRIVTGEGPSTSFGPVLAKVETGNVGGSHKARHLFGLLVGHLIDAAAGADGPEAPFAIASCGNAALGAAVVARAARRRLLVFVPEAADQAVVARLDDLGAEITVCRRQAGEQGDPCFAAMGRAVGDGAVPFTVQGPVCPATIDGCRTLGLELAEQLSAAGVSGPVRLPIQVGGGALATAVMDGLDRSGLDLAVRLHPVQPATAHPYVAAWHRLAPMLLHELGGSDPGTDRGRAAALLAGLRKAGANRSDLDSMLAANAAAMEPWPGTPHSVASGILDDVTYDWQTVMGHQVWSGGWPVVVEEPVFVAARRAVAELVDPPPDETGAAGLAGLMTLQADGGADDPATDVVLLTGVVRSTATDAE